MKKWILGLAALWVCASGFAQSAEEVFQKFRQEKHASYVTVPSYLIRWAGSGDGKHQVEAIKILNLSDCSRKVKKRFIRASADLDTEGYQVLASQNGSREKAQVLVREEGGLISSILVLNARFDRCALVQIDGKFHPDEVGDVVDDSSE